MKRVYDTCVAAGIDVLELGYKADRKMFPGSKSGPWKFCNEDDLRRVVGESAAAADAAPGPIKLSVMADAERTDYHTDILPSDKSVMSVIRVASYIHQIPTALDMIKDAHDKGYETTFNLMAISTVQERELFDALEVVAASPGGRHVRRGQLRLLLLASRCAT